MAFRKGGKEGRRKGGATSEEKEEKEGEKDY